MSHPVTLNESRRQLRACDRVILDALATGPLSTREVSGAILRRAREEWASEHGYFFEWDIAAEPFGARLLAHFEARDKGWKLMPWEIAARLRSMEKRGAVERIQVDGQRPMLWGRRV